MLMSIVSELKESFREGTALVRLIYVNVAVFLAIKLLEILAMFGMPRVPVVEWFGVPIDFVDALMRPWTLVTYMFVHVDFIHLLFNMLCLHWFGAIYRGVLGMRSLLATYLIGGLAGGLAALLCNAAGMPMSGMVMIGASASVMAILLTAAVAAPNYVVQVIFVGEVRLKYYALVFVLLDVISIPRLSNVGGHVAHLGGALAGVLLARRWRAVGTLPVLNISTAAIAKLFRRKPNMKVVHRRPMTDAEFNAARAAREREVDRILEKIKESGYDSLTPDERKMLFDESKRS